MVLILMVILLHGGAGIYDASLTVQRTAETIGEEEDVLDHKEDVPVPETVEKELPTDLENELPREGLNALERGAAGKLLTGDTGLGGFFRAGNYCAVNYSSNNS